MSASFAPQHPVLAAVSTMKDAWAGAADADPIYMSTDDKAAAWLAHHGRRDRDECRRRLRLARDLEKRSTVASALRAGQPTWLRPRSSFALRRSFLPR
jgi:hypothetical protein